MEYKTIFTANNYPDAARLAVEYLKYEQIHGSSNMMPIFRKLTKRLARTYKKPLWIVESHIKARWHEAQPPYRNPHGFLIVDRHLNVKGRGKDFDKLQERVDRHNEQSDDAWFVIDEEDYEIAQKKNPMNVANPQLTRAYRNAINEQLRKAGVFGYLPQNVVEITQFTGNPKTFNVTFANGDTFSVPVTPKTVKPFRTWRLIKSNGMKDELDIIENVSMGFYDETGFHPIRASYDYDESRVDETPLKRPVRRYAQKEKEFLRSQGRVPYSDRTRSQRKKTRRRNGEDETNQIELAGNRLELIENASRHEVVKAFMNKMPKKAGNYTTDGETLRLWGNAIAQWRGSKLYVTDAGWDTVTTKRTLNLIPGVDVVQRNFKWYLNGEEWNGGWAEVKNKRNGRYGNITKNDFTRINNDVNGNPRYVIHFLQLAQDYADALRLAKPLGGRKYHNKQYGGGIVFSTYDLHGLIDDLNEVAPVANVSMGFYDATGFHPIRASYDYDESRVDEKPLKRPVRRYAKQEREFYESRGRRRTGSKRGQTRVMNPDVNSLYNTDKLDALSGIFQGHISNDIHETVGSDYTPPVTARLGKLASIKLVNNGTQYEVSFKGDAWLSADQRQNLYVEGRSGKIKNAALPKKGTMLYLGEVQQINYQTNKQHIENGRLVEYYHELGEVDAVRPNAFLDHDGYIIFVGGNYDIGVRGIQN